METVTINQEHPSAFKLIVDKEISLCTFLPDDAEPLFKLLEQNRARLRPWIHPKSLHETAKATRIFTLECFFDRLGDTEESLTLFRQYSEELGGHFLSPRPSLEMGIWYHSSLIGFISIGRSYDSNTAAEFGYWLAVEQEGKGIYYALRQHFNGLRNQYYENRTICHQMCGEQPTQPRRC